MKKGICLALSLMMLCLGGLAVAEAPAEVPDETTAESTGPDGLIDVTFDGELWDFIDYGFTVMLPKAWEQVEMEDTYFAMADEEKGQVMRIEIADSDGATLEEIAEELEGMDGVENISKVVFSFVPFVTYDSPANDSFGAYGITEDGTTLLHFVFAPSDEEMGNLASQILVSIKAPIDTDDSAPAEGETPEAEEAGATEESVG